MNDENDLSAQDPNLPDGDNNAEGTKEVEDKSVGLQKRIDELTASKGEAERRAQQLQEQTIALLADRATQNFNQPPAEDPYADLDPKTRKFVESTVGAITKRFEGQMAALRNNHEVDLITRGTHRILDSVGADESMKKEASALAAGLRSKGIPVNDEDIADNVIGRAVREGRFKVGGNPVRGAPATIGGVRAATIAAPAPAALPADFDDMDPEAQLAVLSKRGAGNIPL